MEREFMQITQEILEQGYTVEVHHIARGSYFSPHWHDYYELELVLDGEGIHRHNDSEYPVSAGTAYLMSYYNFHALHATTDITILNISFNENLLPAQLMETISLGVNKLACRFEGETWAYVRTLVERISAPSDNKDFMRTYTDSALLTLILAELLRQVDLTPCRHDNSLAQKALAHLYKNFKQDLSLEALAATLSVSSTHLGTVFKREVGIAFNPYLNSVRLRYACNLLLSTHLPVKEIAAAAGYHSVEYFLYVFRAKIGMTPSSYRKQNQRFS